MLRLCDFDFRIQRQRIGTMEETTMMTSLDVAAESPGSLAESRDAIATASATACIELDRFCEQCSYNLRTLPVTTDPRTGIPIVRCTECGRFQPANTTATALRPWLARVTSVTLVGWMLVLVAMFFWLGLAEGAMSYSTLDELTVHGNVRIQRINGTTIRTIGRGDRTLRINEDVPYYRTFVAFVLFVSFLIAMTTGVIAVVVFPHWGRVAYFAIVFGLAILANAFVTVAWRYDAPHLLGWGASYIVAHLGAQLVGGTVGVLAGRPMSRLTIRMLLPPSVRPRLAYLWLADGKPLPGGSAYSVFIQTDRFDSGTRPYDP